MTTPPVSNEMGPEEIVARAMWEKRRELVYGCFPDGLELEEWGDGSIPKANGIMDEARAAIEAHIAALESHGYVITKKPIGFVVGDVVATKDNPTKCMTVNAIYEHKIVCKWTEPHVSCSGPFDPSKLTLIQRGASPCA